jgi:hypothetical protein
LRDEWPSAEDAGTRVAFGAADREVRPSLFGKNGVQ